MKESVGIEIGSTAVRAARLSLSKEPPEVMTFAEAALPKGATKDGEIVDVALVAKAISEAYAGTGKCKNVTVTLANQKVVARIADLPHMDEDELRGAIRYQVQDLIPIPMESAVLDFQVLSEFTNDEQERMMRVLVVAAHKDMVDSYVQACEQAGVSPEAIDFTPLSLMRSLSPDEKLLPDSAGEAEALIDVGGEVTSLVVHENDVPKLARVLAIGGNETHETLVEEIRGSINYYLGQADGGGVSKVVLSGEAEGLFELSPMLSDALHVPVEVGHLQRVSDSRGSMKKMTTDGRQDPDPVMAAAVGAALGALDS